MSDVKPKSFDVMTTCCVYGCGNNSDKTRGVSYLEFPKTEELCRKWILACRRRKKITLKNARVCSEHFKSLGCSDSVGSAITTRQRRCRQQPSRKSTLRSQSILSLSTSTTNRSESGKKSHLVLDLHCPTEKLPSDRPPRITKDEANDITNWCQSSSQESCEDKNLEKMVTKLEGTINSLERENRYLLQNLEALEELNTRTLIEINALKNKLGC